MTRTRRVLAAAAVVTLLAGCTTADVVSAPAPAASGVTVTDAEAPDVDVASLPDADAPAVPMRLADGLAPPTNRWFSGLVFGDVPQPVFPLPVSVGLTASGFAYGLPDVSADGTLVMGGHAAQVQADLGEPVTGVVSGYDAATVVVDLVAGDDAVLGTLRLTRGSPVVTYTAGRDQDLALGRPFAATDGLPADVAATDVEGRTHVLVGADGLDVTGVLAEDGTSLALAADDTVSWLVAPDGGEGSLGDLVEAVRDPVVAAEVGYATSADDVTTDLTWATAGGGPAVVVRFPHQGDAADDVTCGLGTYATVLGTADVCLATTLGWTVPAREPAAAPDLSGVDAGLRDELADQVRADAAAVLAEVRPADTYFGGKALARDANLWSLARELGLDGVAADLHDSLVTDLRTWTEPDGCTTRPERCFTFDGSLRTVVGQAPSFGSDEGNDHHFHYGYLLYAAGVLAADDPALGDDLAPVVDLLAADVAAGADVPVDGGAPMPALRVFDVVMGHSWASGQAPFGDGNNQESSSEAVNAWNGLALWADARGDDALAGEARWLLSAEAASARAYWTDFDTADPAVDGLEASVTSLVWDGKRERATWFSAEPSAALGILVLPVTGVSTYLGGDPDRVRANLVEALGTDDLWADPATWDVMFGDQLLGYAALLGPQDAAAALDVARDLPDERIDDGSTRAWLLAWIASRT
ncbi:endoglucanase Acf2 [Isoptericola jiangsuensis]|uniref:glucan endo-1,3-beta-D-glucosidase n=1 Tax=Isoptericola jiangsuensis TaxID=548579 RepID=A0A2A9F148_9MICO|nr:glycosyl hydrolase [Isoptericola jiangsuensis]PFG44526.1 endoglucanase Acf2 [Isoptericola jiangsuensis]